MEITFVKPMASVGKRGDPTFAKALVGEGGKVDNDKKRRRHPCRTSAWDCARAGIRTEPSAEDVSTPIMVM